MASWAMTEPDLGHVPVPVAVGSIAVSAKSSVVVQPSGVDLGVGPWLPERSRDVFCLAGLDGISDPSVPAGYPLEQQLPLVRVPAIQEGRLTLKIPLVPFSG